MVSIEDRSTYIQRINESLKLKVFHNFLLDKNVSSFFDVITASDEQFLAIVFSIQTSDKTAFEKIYTTKSKSNPCKDSTAPFVNDDYLIFCLIIAITKFKIDKTWIKHIVSIRNRNPTTITFENLINENFSSTSNQTEIVLVFLSLCMQSKIDKNLLNAAYTRVTENTTLLENRNDFQTLCAFRAYDLVIEQKEASEGNEITLLKNFDKNFKIRIKLLSWLLQAIMFLGFIYFLFKLPIYSPKTISLIEKYNFVFTIIGVCGFTLIGNQIPLIKNKTREVLMRVFGYPKELIRNKEGHLKR